MPDEHVPVLIVVPRQPGLRADNIPVDAVSASVQAESSPMPSAGTPNAQAPSTPCLSLDPQNSRTGDLGLD
jgi:hypothetical protein